MHSRNTIDDGLPDNLDLNDEFKSAFDLLENTDLSVFVTGKAGCGKTTLLKYLKAHTKKKIIILAPTGIAAINAGGMTIHSFFKFPPKIVQKDDVRQIYNSALIKNLDMLVIDEVSMCRVDLMDGIDYSLRINRGVNAPFGGVQVAFFGDLYQLCPVVEKEAREVLRKKYPTPYFFSAQAFDDFDVKYIELSKIYRQMDTKFINLLNRLRSKKHTEKDLQLLNKQVRKNAIRSVSDGTIILTPTNSLAGAINQDKLLKLPGRVYTYDAVVSGRFDMSAYPTDTSLKLKKGAQVILIKNDPDKKWVNGTFGKIAELSDDSIAVDIDGHIYQVHIASWNKIEYRYNEEEDKIEENIVGSFVQYPLKLSWAVTVHKSQGQTFNKLILDLGHGAFAHGQVYVALSRCTSLGGITLKRPVIHSDILFDKCVHGFRERFTKYDA